MNRYTSRRRRSRKTRRSLRRNSNWYQRAKIATRAREAFARGDTASANRALAELRVVDIALMPKAAMRKNSRRRTSLLRNASRSDLESDLERSIAWSLEQIHKIDEALPRMTKRKDIHAVRAALQEASDLNSKAFRLSYANPEEATKLAARTTEAVRKAIDLASDIANDPDLHEVWKRKLRCLRELRRNASRSEVVKALRKVEAAYKKLYSIPVWRDSSYRAAYNAATQHMQETNRQARALAQSDAERTAIGNHILRAERIANAKVRPLASNRRTSRRRSYR